MSMKGYYVSGNTLTQELSECVKSKELKITSTSEWGSGTINVDPEDFKGCVPLLIIVSCLFNGDYEYAIADLTTPSTGVIGGDDIGDFDKAPDKVVMLYK